MPKAWIHYRYFDHQHTPAELVKYLERQIKGFYFFLRFLTS